MNEPVLHGLRVGGKEANTKNKVIMIVAMIVQQSDV